MLTFLGLNFKPLRVRILLLKIELKPSIPSVINKLPTKSNYSFYINVIAYFASASIISNQIYFLQSKIIFPHKGDKRAIAYPGRADKIDFDLAFHRESAITTPINAQLLVSIYSVRQRRLKYPDRVRELCW